MQPLTALLKPEQYLKDGQIDIDTLKSNTPFPYIAAPRKQTVRVPGTEQKNYSSAYRSAHLHGGDLVDRAAPQLDTILDALEIAFTKFADLPCLGTRRELANGEFDNKFTYQTYSDIQKRRDHIGSGLRTLVGRDDKFVVGLYSANRSEWVISMLAAQAYNMVYTALYDTLGPKTSAYILNFTETPIVVISRNKLSSILELKKTNSLPTLHYVVTMEPLNMERDFGLIQLAESRGLKLLDFDQLEQIGKANPLPLVKTTPDTTYGLSFTSGTTGNPKGVEITQRMSAAFVAFSMSSVVRGVSAPDQLRVFSFLPLAHIYEVSNLSMQLFQGCSIAFPPDPSPLKLVENMCIVKPHIVALVPRVYTKMEAALKDKMSNSVIGRQVLKGIENKISNATDEALPQSLILDSLALNGVRKKLGVDQATNLISGSAPISGETVNFLRAAFGTGFSQGYGLTESTSGVFIAFPYERDVTCGSVGITTEFRLRALPEMNYHTHDSNGQELDEPHGELLLRGPQIFPRYFKSPQATEEAFDEDGWFKTGDVARLDSRGRILIIDRVKNFFKLAQGEYITPERIENTYLSVCSFLTQLYAHGDSMKTYLVAIAGVDPDAFKAYLARHRKTSALSRLSIDEILKKINNSPDLKKLVLSEMDAHVKSEGLHGFEKLHNVEFKVEPLKISDETITPTLKIKRNVASRFFKETFEQLYSEGSLLKPNKL